MIPFERAIARIIAALLLTSERIIPPADPMPASSTIEPRKFERRAVCSAAP